MLAEPPKPGAIVSITTHPYFKGLTDIIISGEHQLTPPLMVVAEVIKDTQIRYNEKTGDDESYTGLCQCRCIWFSQKTNQFEEAWLSSKMLKLIQENSTGKIKKEDAYEIIQPEASNTGYRKYKQVVFKTAELELGKKKSILSYDESLSSLTKEEKTSINAYLAFVSPVMEVIQVIDPKDVEPNSAKYDIKTGKERRTTSDCLLKVKWFNAISDKFSEKILPADIFNFVENVDQTLIKLKNYIKEATYLSYETAEVGHTIITPLSISFRAGKYYLKAFDYVLNKKQEIEIKADFQLDEVKELIIKSIPTFSFILDEKGEESFIAEEIKDVLQGAIVTKNYIRFEYRNAKGKVNWKTIKVSEVSPKKYGKDHDYYYFQGYYIAKKEERTFKTSNVIIMHVLNLQYE